MSFPLFKQYDSMDCGPACLKMVAAHYRRKHTLQELREKTQIGKDGVNLYGISKAAAAIGFDATASKLNIDSISIQKNLPAILHWNQNHFVVLYKATTKQFFIADPARGFSTYTPEQFASSWLTKDAEGIQHGIALLLTPLAPLQVNEQTTTNTQKTKGFVQYLLPHKKAVIKVIACMAMVTVLQLLLPFLTKSIIDKGIQQKDLNMVVLLLLGQFALFTGRIFIEFIRTWILTKLSLNINISIVTDFVKKLMKLPLAFFDSKRTGDLLQRMRDHTRIESFLTGSSLSTLFSIINLVIFSVVLLYFYSSIYFIFLAATTLYTIWILMFLQKRKQLDQTRFAISSEEQSLSIQVVQGMQDVKLNGVEPAIEHQWQNLQTKLYTIGLKALRIHQKQQSGSSFINEVKNLLITFLCALAVIEGQITLGSLMAIQFIIGQLNSPVEQLLGFIQNWQNATLSMNRLNEIHQLDDEENTEQKLMQHLPVGFTKKADACNFFGSVSSPSMLFQEQNIESIIHIKRLWFTYSGAGNDPVLTDIDFKIPKGKITAIVGQSGSGKTTLLKLLLKFYDLKRGDIFLDDVSLSQISHGYWRRHCGAVLQDSFIFSDTILRNIAVGHEVVDERQLQKAIQIAQLQDILEKLPNGLETKIGAEGNGMSMGQRQRILIARAVYKDPDFLFFDEATNSLDTKNESRIINNLQKFFCGRTVVIVAHRLSTVRHADQIVVLDKGRVAEKGKHDDLIRLEGVYHSLVKNQLGV
jgi:ATP-binding cassette subfamily B protein